MKRAILAQRLPHFLMALVLTALLVASSVVLPAPSAQAAGEYFDDTSIHEDLSFESSMYIGEKDEVSEEIETEDSKEICEKVESVGDEFFRNRAEEFQEKYAISNQQVKDCHISGSHIFVDYSGKYDENLLMKATAEDWLRVTGQNEIVMKVDLVSWDSEEFLGKDDNIGIRRLTFPGRIKSINPDVGQVSGNTWTQDRHLTAAERDKLGNTDDMITITAERQSSNLGLILGITIPAALIIVAVIVLLIVRSNRKKKQQSLPPYPAGYGAYPPPPFMPGNSANPSQPQVPGYPAAPGAPGMPGAAPYPPNVPPPGQPGAVPYPPNVPPPAQPAAPTPGGYSPYPFPYPPANPQGSPAGYPMPNQAYGTPTSGFQPPVAPPQPAARQQGNLDDLNQATESHSGKHAASSPQPGQSGKPAKSLASTQSDEEDGRGNPDGSNQASDSHQPKHAVEPAQADLTVLKTDPSEALTPQHSIPAEQAEHSRQEN